MHRFGRSARQNDGNYTGIGLSWSAVLGASSYNIYRSTVSGGSYVIIQSVPGTTTTYNDLNVQQGVVYYYVVRAMTGCLSGNSPQAGAIRSRC